MRKSPKVSVIMSVYNGERFLRESIDSILNQTFRDFEFIIINDGSTDRTGEILDSYSDERIKIFNQSNQGLTKSLNKALRLARGEYIARQDADDISEPNRLEVQVAYLESHPDIGLVGSFAKVINEQGDFTGNELIVPDFSEEIFELLPSRNCLLHGSVMFKRDIIDLVGNYNENFPYAQDYEFWIRISQKFKVANIPKYLYRFRIHHNQIANVHVIQHEKVRNFINNFSIRRAYDDSKEYKLSILFIYPNVNVATQSMGVNHGVTSLSAVLRHNGFETNLLKIVSEDFKFGVRRAIELSKPDIVAISTTFNHWELTKKIAKFIKENYSLLIFTGGTHNTAYPDSIMETQDIDGICIGEGEEALLELVEKIWKGEDYYDTLNFWFRKDGEIIKNDLRPLIDNLDRLPIPDWEIFDQKSIINYPNLSFSRGCPYDCSYCCNGKFREIYSKNGWRVRFKSVDRALEEIEEFLKRYKPPVLMFDDDTFIESKHWREKFLVEYRKRFSFPFWCNARPELINDEICKLLKDAGCEGVAIAIESGSEEIRERVLNRRISDELIITAFKIAKKRGLKTSSFNMVGIPGEAPEDFQKTIGLNRKIMPDRMQLAIFYPGTRLGDYCFDKGYVKVNRHPNYFEETGLDLPTYPSERIREDSHLFHFEVYKDFDIDKALKSIDTEAKRKSFKKRYKDDPNFDYYWAKINEEEEIERGKRFILEGNIDRAIEIFEEVLKVSPENIVANYHFGSCCQRRRDYEKAREKFEHVLSLKTNNEIVYHAGAHFHLGEIYQAQGDLDKARAEFRECLRLNPAHRKARESLDTIGHRIKEVE
jgi:radical SAM superfamily enzyme YgiQ (UPF0313 family)